MFVHVYEQISRHRAKAGNRLYHVHMKADLWLGAAMHVV